ncbi:uncharacterized protein LOC126901480 isoform X3 [Daktulosphaira vitifoliae]|uniref:uncharacterized protein LOC126901480 isoform X2 n=1 Tax=Daktulosphaira vitifoliae TaxID=58002 RepID=UPI0021AA175D|nr:uncharacterized protein LOC126901480 isoform X2 [Daktulosphaira vitifoliae]XP_050533902.1 uncharacterized protein LOC126901480 isoform X3 [Daktulosphaira vitifoliae]
MSLYFLLKVSTARSNGLSLNHSNQKLEYHFNDMSVKLSTCCIINNFLQSNCKKCNENLNDFNNILLKEKNLTFDNKIKKDGHNYAIKIRREVSTNKLQNTAEVFSIENNKKFTTVIIEPLFNSNTALVINNNSSITEKNRELTSRTEFVLNHTVSSSTFSNLMTSFYSNKNMSTQEVSKFTNSIEHNDFNDTKAFYFGVFSSIIIFAIGLFVVAYLYRNNLSSHGRHIRYGVHTTFQNNTETSISTV